MRVRISPFEARLTVYRLLGKAAADALIWMMSRNSHRVDKAAIALSKWLERLARLEDHKEHWRQFRALWEGDHPSLRLVRRLFTELHPRVRKGILENLLINATFVGALKRRNLHRQGKAAPVLLVISPAQRCNLRCKGCYAAQYAEEELPFDVFDRVIREGKEMGTYFYVISGGEPFVYPRLLEIFEKHSDCAFLIYTNGTLITKEMARRLAELGNAAPAVSIEGMEEETERRRGKGVFKRVMEAFDNMREAGMLYGFSATATRENTASISSEEFIQLMVEKGCYFGWYFTYIPIGHSPSLEYMPTPEQRNRLREAITHFRDRYPIFVADFWGDGRLTGGCMAGGRIYAHINASGIVEPCVFFQFYADNIKEKPLEEALNSPFFKAIRRRFPWTENELRPCPIIDCPWVLREAVKEGGAKPSNAGVLHLLSESADFVDRYALEYLRIVDPVWERLKREGRVTKGRPLPLGGKEGIDKDSPYVRGEA